MRAHSLLFLLPLVTHPLAAAFPVRKAKPWFTKRLRTYITPKADLPPVPTSNDASRNWSTWGAVPLVSILPGQEEGGTCDASFAAFRCGGPTFQTVQCRWLNIHDCAAPDSPGHACLAPMAECAESWDAIFFEMGFEVDLLASVAPGMWVVPWFGDGVHVRQGGFPGTASNLCCGRYPQLRPAAKHIPDNHGKLHCTPDIQHDDALWDYNHDAWDYHDFCDNHNNAQHDRDAWYDHDTWHHNHAWHHHNSSHNDDGWHNNDAWNHHNFWDHHYPRHHHDSRDYHDFRRYYAVAATRNDNAVAGLRHINSAGDAQHTYSIPVLHLNNATAKLRLNYPVSNSHAVSIVHINSNHYPVTHVQPINYAAYSGDEHAAYSGHKYFAYPGHKHVIGPLEQFFKLSSGDTQHYADTKPRDEHPAEVGNCRADHDVDERRDHDTGDSQFVIIRTDAQAFPHAYQRFHSIVRSGSELFGGAASCTVL
ncbi:unnamed protein product [Cutaneotrichosporon oleaginosum]